MAAERHANGLRAGITAPSAGLDDGASAPSVGSVRRRSARLWSTLASGGGPSPAAGSTGAQMAASMVILRLHAGLKRPAIVTLFPSARRTVAVLDSAANVDCSAEELVQFARLGAT